LTIHEVIQIKNEKSKITKSMTIDELKLYYTDCLNDFNSIMKALTMTIVNDEKDCSCNDSFIASPNKDEQVN